MIIYLVSSNGDVVYINNQGIVFKNGEPLNQNQGKVNFLAGKMPRACLGNAADEKQIIICQLFQK